MFFTAFPRNLSRVSTFRRIPSEQILTKASSDSRTFILRHFSQQQNLLTSSTAMCRRHAHVQHSACKTVAPFDRLTSDQRSYLERIKKDYQSSLEVTLHKHSTPAQRFVNKFADLHTAYSAYCAILQDMAECSSMLADPDMQELAKAELSSLTTQLEEAYRGIEGEISETLHPTRGDVILELRMATGGLESSLFTNELKVVYQNLAMSLGYSWKVLDEDREGEGLSRIEVEISGPGAYSIFQFEGGVHRVQRIPVNDTRVHTSTVVVIVMLKPEDLQVDINPNDLVVKYARSSGPGGQGVASTFSKCIMLHKPSGRTITSQATRAADQNKLDCLAKLHNVLLHEELNARDSDYERKQKQQAMNGDRSDKIRTYSYKTDRITDHRYKVSTAGIEDYLSNPSKFMGFHETVSRHWQLGKLAELASDLSK